MNPLRILSPDIDPLNLQDIARADVQRGKSLVQSRIPRHLDVRKRIPSGMKSVNEGLFIRTPREHGAWKF